MRDITEIIKYEWTGYTREKYQGRHCRQQYCNDQEDFRSGKAE